MSSVYLETSVISYLAADISDRLVVAAHQQSTHNWWDNHRRKYELFVSEQVIDEIAAGNPKQAEKRLKLVSGIPLLKSNSKTNELLRSLLSTGVFPGKAAVDAIHVAVAVAHGIDFLLTWNCKHLANAAIWAKIDEVCESLGYSPIVICTTDTLAAEDEGNDD